MTEKAEALREEFAERMARHASAFAFHGNTIELTVNEKELSWIAEALAQPAAAPLGREAIARVIAPSTFALADHYKRKGFVNVVQRDCDKALATADAILALATAGPHVTGIVAKLQELIQDLMVDNRGTLPISVVLDRLHGVLHAAPAVTQHERGEAVDITGWKLVPDEPTEGMWQAGRSADINPGDSYSKIWRAMFDAAPNVDDCETTATPSAVDREKLIEELSAAAEQVAADEIDKTREDVIKECAKFVETFEPSANWNMEALRQAAKGLLALMDKGEAK